MKRRGFLATLIGALALPRWFQKKAATFPQVHGGESYIYRYTFVNSKGEENPPSRIGER